MNGLSAQNRRLAASAAFALLVGTGAWAYVDRAQRRLEAGLPVSTVLIAKRYIPAGETVSADRVEQRRVPTAYLEPTALTDAAVLKSGPAALRARVGLLKGEQLTRSKLESPSSRLGVAWSVLPGDRALALRLPLERAVGGLVLPGDLVDLIAVDRRPGADGARTLAAAIRVLAVQDRLWDPASPPVFAGGPPGDTIVVTIMLAPADAARVASSAERDAIHLALRSPLAPKEP